MARSRAAGPPSTSRDSAGGSRASAESSHDSPPRPEELTIDELARRTGTTVRNIRAHQSRGLLPPPTIRARTGYYGLEHVARVQMIQAMQAEGFRLDAIQRLLEHPGGAGERIFDFGRTLLSSFGELAPEFATSSELQQRLGGPLDPRLLRKAEKLGLLRPLGDDRWELRNPTLIAAGEQLAAMGIPLSHAIAVAEKIDRHTRAIAEAYVRLFLSDVIGGDGISERPAEDWDHVNTALERLRPLALDAIRASFEQAMGEIVEREVQKFIGRR
jgi:DNA-binding transcriptional MerR regulator